MNTYYSNLIEDHHTRPRDIEGAVAGELDYHKKLRDLQLEAKAQVRVQAEVDELFANGRLPDPTSSDFILYLHREFYRNAPESMLRIKGAGREFVMEPREWRSLPEHDVAVGQHLPPSSNRVPGFMRHFGARYRQQRQGKGSRIRALPAAHHRLATETERALEQKQSERRLLCAGDLLECHSREDSPGQSRLSSVRF